MKLRQKALIVFELFQKQKEIISKIALRIPIRKSGRIHKKFCCILTAGFFFWQEYPAHKSIYLEFQINQKILYDK